MKKDSIEAARLTVRIPLDVKNWLNGQTIRNANSNASEIVRAVRERMERTNPPKCGRTSAEGERDVD